jgi:acetyl esterase
LKAWHNSPWFEASRWNFPDVSFRQGTPTRSHPYHASWRRLPRNSASLDSLFFPDAYTPPLPHEYQFNLDIEAGRIALERSIKFLAVHLQ